MTVGELLDEAIRRLGSSNIEGGARDARLILRHVLGEVQPWLYPETVVSDDVSDMFLRNVDQRCDHQPVAQIIGKREFWGRDFKVTTDTLDPRPESETLIEVALRLAPVQSILDLGTGTGCLLLTLLAEVPNATGEGVDLSDAALAVARDNAERLGVADRASFMQSHWFEQVSGRYDLIICNPPYISESEMSSLQPDVTQWEPHLALTPGDDGLGAYREISKGISAHLSKDGRAIFEMGSSQADQVGKIFMDAGLEVLEVLTDINGNNRGLLVRLATL